MEENTMNPNMSPKNGSAGPVIGIIIVLVIIILGGLYFWNNRTEDSMDNNPAGTYEEGTPESTQDDTASIEADLNSSDVDNLDAELNAS